MDEDEDDLQEVEENVGPNVSDLLTLPSSIPFPDVSDVHFNGRSDSSAEESESEALQSEGSEEEALLTPLSKRPSAYESRRGQSDDNNRTPPNAIVNRSLSPAGDGTAEHGDEGEPL